MANSVDPDQTAPFGLLLSTACLNAYEFYGNVNQTLFIAN